MRLADILTDCGAVALVAGVVMYDVKLGLIVGGGASMLVGVIMVLGAKAR